MEKPSVKTDEYDLFGKYIAAELRTTENVQARFWAKLQMLNIRINIQTGMRSMPPFAPVPHCMGLTSTPTGSFSSYEEPQFGSPFDPESDV